MNFTVPSVSQTKFTCPHCGVLAQQTWSSVHLARKGAGLPVSDKIRYATCEACNQYTLWHLGKLVFPDVSSAPMPHPQMPTELLGDYNEARSIAARSPRGAAALLRLALQKLCRLLGQPGKNINDDIAAMVAAGLPVEIQQSLDALRVIGNESVHPGELNLDDTPEMVISLFSVLNYVIEDRISRPKKLAELYANLPASKLAAIESRDSKT